jgi:Malic enzyme, N-terminal domain
VSNHQTSLCRGTNTTTSRHFSSRTDDSSTKNPSPAATATVVDEQDGLFCKEDIPETGEWAGCRRSFMAPLQINCSGTDALYNPLFNKGTAFKSGERDRLRFRGLLPYRMTNIQLQKERFLVHLRSETSPIKKNLALEDLHDRNETLYHRVLVDHMDEMAPLIYTPTVGQACLEFGARFRRPRGMYFTPYDRGNMAASTLRCFCFALLGFYFADRIVDHHSRAHVYEPVPFLAFFCFFFVPVVYNWPHKDVHIIVVTVRSVA